MNQWLENGQQKVLNAAFSESFQDSVLGLFTVFVITLVVALLFIYLTTAVLRKWLKKQVNNTPTSLEEEPSFLRQMLQTKGLWLAKCVLWFRFSSAFFVTLALFSQFLIDFKNEALTSVKYKTLANIATKLSDLSEIVWQKGWKVFLFSLAGIVLASFIGDAIKHFINATVIQNEENNHPRAALRAKTLEATSVYLIRAIIFVLILLFCLQALGISIGPLLATAGVASVAIGFGAQSLVKDLFSGIFILLEDQFAVGDVIEVNGRGGQVESMTFRITRLRTADGSLLVIPNGEMKLVRNSTSVWARVDFKIKIPLSESSEKCIEALKKACQNITTRHRNEIIGDPEYLGIDKIDEGYATYRFWLKTLATKRNSVERSLNEEALMQLNLMGIKLLVPA